MAKEKDTVLIGRGFVESRPNIPDPFKAIRDIAQKGWNLLEKGGTDAVAAIAAQINSATGKQIQTETLQQAVRETSNADEMVARLIEIEKMNSEAKPLGEYEPTAADRRRQEQIRASTRTR
jgi:hypothetical protein